MYCTNVPNIHDTNRILHLGVAIGEVQSFVENHLKDMVLKTFDPKKADTIFSEEGEVCCFNCPSRKY